MSPSLRSTKSRCAATAQRPSRARAPTCGACVRVQLIPSKEHSEMYQQYVEPSWPDDDELDADADLLADDDDPLFAVVSA